MVEGMLRYIVQSHKIVSLIKQFRFFILDLVVM